MRVITHFMALVAVLLCCSCPAKAVSDADSVRACLLIMSAARPVYSALGHAALRLSSPTYGLDYCFTYGMDMRPSSQWRFFTGHAPAGHLAAPTAAYLREYADEGRRVTSYELNLTLEEKRRLWQYLDTQTGRGLCDAYDFLHNGCAQVCLRAINAALTRTEVRYDLPQDDPLLTASPRELAHSILQETPWADFFWMTVSGTDIDAPQPLERSILVPRDLLRALSHAVLIDSAGTERPLLIKQPEVLVPATQASSQASGPFTPAMLACIFIALACLASMAEYKGRWKAMVCAVDAILLGVQTLMGLFVTYLVCCSDLVNTSWTWLLIPYNPLPILVVCYYRWHRHASVPPPLLLVASLVLLVSLLLCGFTLAHQLFLFSCFIRISYKFIHIKFLITNKKQ